MASPSRPRTHTELSLSPSLALGVPRLETASHVCLVPEDHMEHLIGFLYFQQTITTESINTLMGEEVQCNLCSI